MTLPVSFRPQAAAEAHAAHQWYEERRSGLGDEFRGALDQLIDRVGRQPESFPRVHQNIRRALLERFPFGVYSRLSTTWWWYSAWCMDTETRRPGHRDVEA
jgi:hypothetical protein